LAAKSGLFYGHYFNVIQITVSGRKNDIIILWFILKAELSFFFTRKKSETVPKTRQQNHPPDAAAANVNRGEFSWHQNYGMQNPAYETSGDDDAYAAKHK